MNFRRWFTAVAVLTLFASLAFAQTYGSGGGAMTCSTVTQVTPQIRAEGVTELVGDIVITCSGGTASASGTIPIPQGNIIVSLSAPVTSRLTTQGAPSVALGTPSEAILLVDDPNSGEAGPVPGYGPYAPLSVCPNADGCTEYPTEVIGPNGAPYIVATASAQTTVPYTGSPIPGWNVFQGNVSGGGVISFQGVPFLPPVTSGVVRTFRITNVRVAPGGVGAITATISTNGQSTLSITTPNVTVAYAANSISTSVTNNTTTWPLCSPSSYMGVATLNFTEMIPGAFKTRIAPVGTYSSYIGTTGAGYYDSVGVNLQDIPGQLYTSESGFIIPLNLGVQAGLADFGTRLKATFANLPSNVTVYVTATSTTTAPSYPGSFNALETPYAVLVSTTGVENAILPVTFTAPTYVAWTALSGTSPEAVWEVVNSNTSATADFTFNVAINYGANVPVQLVNPGGVTSPPPAGTPSVTLAYAPTNVSGLTNIPRFLAGSGALSGIISIGPCQTILLFPYLTDITGWDSGIAISNTSADPWSTTNQAGNCSLSFYGANAPTGAVLLPPTGTIAAGSSAATLLSALVPAQNFTGYAFAVCNFQFAHGFAFLSDYGLRNWATDYLALVVTSPGATPPPRGTIATPKTLPVAEGFNN